MTDKEWKAHRRVIAPGFYDEVRKALEAEGLWEAFSEELPDMVPARVVEIGEPVERLFTTETLLDIGQFIKDRKSYRRRLRRPTDICSRTLGTIWSLRI